MMKRVVHVVDDDASFLRSVSRLLRASGFDVATYSSVHDFLNRKQAEAPGCVLTDLQMPRQDGLDLQQALARSGNPLPVVFLTSKGDIPTSVRAMRMGAEDFLTKRTPKAKLLEAIERALQRDTTDRSRREARTSARAKIEALAQRERQVLSGIVRGLLNKQIADELGIAERTVKHHRTALAAKLGVQSGAEMALLASSAGAVDAVEVPPSPGAA
jgi:FixJ family two-component response regulator